MFDISSAPSFESAKSIIALIDKHIDPDTVKMLIGNKSDLPR